MSRYSATVMDHFSSPRNSGEMQGPDLVGVASLRGKAPYVMFFLRVDGDTIQKANFKTFGCGAAIACGSMLTEMISGRSLNEARAIRPDQLVQALDGLPSEKRFCAELTVSALSNALEDDGD